MNELNDRSIIVVEKFMHYKKYVQGKKCRKLPNAMLYKQIRKQLLSIQKNFLTCSKTSVKCYKCHKYAATISSSDRQEHMRVDDNWYCLNCYI